MLSYKTVHCCCRICNCTSSIHIIFIFVSVFIFVCPFAGFGLRIIFFFRFFSAQTTCNSGNVRIQRPYIICLKYFLQHLTKTINTRKSRKTFFSRIDFRVFIYNCKFRLNINRFSTYTVRFLYTWTATKSKMHFLSAQQCTGNRILASRNRSFSKVLFVVSHSQMCIRLTANSTSPFVRVSCVQIVL